MNINIRKPLQRRSRHCLRHTDCLTSWRVATSKWCLLSGRRSFSEHQKARMLIDQRIGAHSRATTLKRPPIFDTQRRAVEKLGSGLKEECIRNYALHINNEVGLNIYDCLWLETPCSQEWQFGMLICYSISLGSEKLNSIKLFKNVLLYHFSSKFVTSKQLLLNLKCDIKKLNLNTHKWLSDFPVKQLELQVSLSSQRSVVKNHNTTTAYLLIFEHTLCWSTSSHSLKAVWLIGGWDYQ